MTGRGAHLASAEALAREGRLAAAVGGCFAALAADERDVLAHALLGGLFLEEGFYEEAISSASRAIELDARCAPAYLALGLAYDQRGGMWDRSILVWSELAEVVPDLAIAHVQLGEACSACGLEDEAIAEWRIALELCPSDARALYNLSVSALKRMGMTTALPGFRMAGELDASQDAFFFSLVRLDGEEVAAPDPTVADPAALDPMAATVSRGSRLRAAYALARKDDLIGSAGLAREVLDGNADDADALALAGFLYLKQEAANEAMAVALRSLAVSTRTPAAVYVLGAAFAKRKGLSRNAARVFGALARAVPDQPMAQVLLAESLIALQRYGAAKDAYLCAIELDPGCVRARFGLAAMLLTEGEYAQAQWEIRRAAYYDTRRRDLFWQLYDVYAGQEADRAGA